MGRVEIAVGDNGMVTFWLDNPGKLNALNETMLATLTNGIRHHGAQAACRLIVIRGRNGTFCAGRDVAGLQRTEGSAPPDALEQIRPARELAETLIGCPVPTVAAVAGRAVGLGMGMVVWCDMAICETSATFSVPEARIGIPPSMIALSLVRAIGPRATADLVLRGRTVGAEHALQVGLIQKVCEDDSGIDTDLAALSSDVWRCSPAALRSSKRLLREITDMPFDDGFSRAIEVAAASLGSADAIEGMHAFRSKRPPTWTLTPTPADS
ncbi:enoyl-CoA hydratase/isomerase family protein [Ottowia thiooxydans]|uniref:Methylglutaconyl-CoA hydratase n=1 Tax=Ottowia thiooxydans TaxID=219182 RepID=A0ABV2Q2W0_9BURK